MVGHGSQAILICAFHLGTRLLTQASLSMKFVFVNFESPKIEYCTVYIMTYCHIVTYHCMICDTEFGHVMAALHAVT